jgi:phthiocerol/phenolphthiocerol synthesis type-I polyketide synthase E
VTRTPEPVAVVGMAGRFPGAADVSAFSANVRTGVVSIAFPGDDQLAAAGVPEAARRDPAYVKAVAAAPQLDSFDAGFFGFTSRDARVCDPQIRVFLDTAHAALEHAGYAAGEDGDVGVFGSAGANRYLHLVAPSTDALRSTTGMSLSSLNNADSLSTLTSYKLGLRGPSLTVQTACSSSLVAVHLAAQSLSSGECGMALAGGVDIEIPPDHGYWWEPGGPLSRDGRCRPFDAAADGMLFSSGAGVVVLKPLSDAIADGDTIHAVIRSTAVNNDGSGRMGFSAPGVTGQAAVVAEAIALSGLASDDITLVEAHGTGTALGDPVEVAALNAAFRRMARVGLPRSSCALTSAKGNVGHLGHAAGVASLIRAVLAVRDGFVPPNASLVTPNPKLELDDGPFWLPTEARGWDRSAGRPRNCGVSSLGIGGTNVHAVVSEPPPAGPDRAVAEPPRPRIVVWSARSTAAADLYRDRLAEHFRTGGDEAFPATVGTLQRGRTAHPVRRAVVVSTAAEATAALADPSGAAVVRSGDDAGRRLIFLFPGQGAQHSAMAAELYEHVPAFAAAADECLDLFEAEGIRLRPLWPAPAAAPDVSFTLVAQPLLFTIEHAATAMWRAWGVTPAVVLGHSIGELVAGTEAGVFTLADGVRATTARSRAMSRRPAGGMLAVAASEAAVRPLLVETVTVAVVNGPRHTVVAGPFDALTEFRTRAETAGLACRPLETSHAFHHPSMAEAVGEFDRALGDIELRPPRTVFRSAATGREVTAAEATSPEFWSRQLVEPVRFDTALATLLDGDPALLIEVGPGRTLTALARQRAQATPHRHRAVATLPPRRTDPPEDRLSALTALAAVWTEGYDVDWAAADGTARIHRLPVPGYPYQRERYWAEPAPPAAVGPEPAAIPAAVSAFTLLSWSETPRPPAADRPDGAVAAVLLPADAGPAQRVTRLVRRAGYRVAALRFGESYAERTSGFTVRPGEPDDLTAAFSALASRDEPAEVVVHAATLGDAAPDVDGQLRRGFHAAADLVRRSTVAGRGPRLLVLTEGSVDVSGGDQLIPGHAALPALVRTLCDEEDGARCRLVDIGPHVPDGEIADELGTDEPAPVVALRGERRWTPADVPFQPSAAAGDDGLRRGGVYLVTGGLGGLGTALARGLARTGLAPRLVLVGRRGRIDPAVRAELDALGAPTRAAACDVTDAIALGALTEEVTAEWGPLSGVFHLAGVPGTGLVRRTATEATATTFAPKVTGVAALAAVLSGHPPLDFFVAFSSRAATDGEPGGADYAAANAVLDALVRSGTVPARRALTINWPGWRGEGMVAARPAGSGRPEDRGIPPAAGVDLLLELLSARTPRQVVVRRFRDGRPVAPSSAPTRTTPAGPAVARSARTGTAEAGTAEAGDQVAPAATVLDQVASLFAEVLGAPEVNGHTDFFREGGNSLTAVELISRVRKQFGVGVGISAIFEHRTPAALAGELRRQGAR